MLTLRTGIPRSGKTLGSVADLLAEHESWCKPGGPARRVVYSNVDGLTLPHWPLPLGEPVLDKFGEVKYTPILWDKIERGSRTIIDEAWKFFPPAGIGENVPDHMRFLSEHGHTGDDIELITQHPKDLHTYVRRRVGRHIHVRRVFGWGRAMKYEWDHCSDQLAFKDAVTSQFTYPKRVFSLYKSADIHTKQVFKKPWWIWLPIPVIALAAWAIPTAWASLGNIMSGKGVVDVFKPQAGVTALASPVAAATPSWLAEAEKHRGKPLLPADYSDGPQAAASAPATAGPQSGKVAPDQCVMSADRCRCLDDGGVLVVRELAVCQSVFGDRAPLVVRDRGPAQAVARAEDLAALEMMAKGRRGPVAPW